ncbi:metallophosphoesterase 1 [Amyelois transitella]|uniref:metallophosphoesterase 1 n=1 Tax=Amyelois transitella TaxID=680683 RepID=UPI00067B4323|nr:metallophosphoesterase 1 [Amyelois transitella]
MFFKRSTTVKYSIAALVVAVLYCEWFIYLAQPFYWPSLECEGVDASCTRVLFIADPQIQGDTAVAPPLSYLFNWDSDRYLKSTFSVVLNHFKPDVLVYMGDLMDEGSIATMQQFHGYVKRLSKIFEINYSVVQIWLPGDNDIGGEGEPIKKDKVKEFAEVFEQPDVITFKNISFYKVNGITYTVPHEMELVDNNYKIVVSHYPVTHKHSFIHKMNAKIRPDIYFSAHDHDSKYVKQKRDLTQRQALYPLYSVLHIPRGDWLYEISVPTCSYRMGTSKIGYGAAVFENNNSLLHYTVFWSPQRFPYLLFYAFVLIPLCLYCLIFCQYRLLRCRETTSRKTDEVPLLKRV